MTTARQRLQDEVILEDAQIIWRNFAGEEKPFNTAGKRNFSIVLPQDLAIEMRSAGWNVKEKPPREDGDEPFYHLPVTVKFGKNPPRLFMITRSTNRRTPLDEDLMPLLDRARFTTVDLIIRPYNWDVNGKQGVTAYLSTGFFTIHENRLELKYAHIPEVGEVEAVQSMKAIERAGVGDYIDGEDLGVEIVGGWDDGYEIESNMKSIER
jgi:hypothetical protein